MPPPELHGLLVLDKPVGPTSRDAVDRALRWFPRKTRVGHTGTLDPLASGVLVLCIGHATRLTEFVQDMGKVYVADLVFGARSATDDAEGPIEAVTVDCPPNRDLVLAALASFVGAIEQVPPAFSAAKVAGRRAYDLARGGVTVELRPRTIRIDAIELLDYEYPRARLGIRCGKGTYIRSLARDLGERLGCGAHLDGLRRTRVGPFSTDDAAPLDSNAETAMSRLLPSAAAVADLPRVDLSADEVALLRHGRAVKSPNPAITGTAIAVFDSANALIAIAMIDASVGLLRPAKVFPA